MTENPTIGGFPGFPSPEIGHRTTFKKAILCPMSASALECQTTFENEYRFH